MHPLAAFSTRPSFSSDGRLIAMGVGTKVAVWNVSTRERIRELEGHTRRLHVAFQPGTHLLASASLDRSVRLWDVDSGACLANWDAHTKEIGDLAFSPSGARVATVAWDDAIRVWTVR